VRGDAPDEPLRNGSLFGIIADQVSDLSVGQGHAAKGPPVHSRKMGPDDLPEPLGQTPLPEEFVGYNLPRAYLIVQLPDITQSRLVRMPGIERSGLVARPRGNRAQTGAQLVVRTQVTAPPLGAGAMAGFCTRCACWGGTGRGQAAMIHAGSST
jgi:hypothetical protein